MLLINITRDYLKNKIEIRVKFEKIIRHGQQGRRISDSSISG